MFNPTAALLSLGNVLPPASSTLPAGTSAPLLTSQTQPQLPTASSVLSSAIASGVNGFSGGVSLPTSAGVSSVLSSSITPGNFISPATSISSLPTMSAGMAAQHSTGMLSYSIPTTSTQQRSIPFGQQSNSQSLGVNGVAGMLSAPLLALGGQSGEVKSSKSMSSSSSQSGEQNRASAASDLTVAPRPVPGLPFQQQQQQQQPQHVGSIVNMQQPQQPGAYFMQQQQQPQQFVPQQGQYLQNPMQHQQQQQQQHHQQQPIIVMSQNGMQYLVSSGGAPMQQCGGMIMLPPGMTLPQPPQQQGWNEQQQQQPQQYVGQQQQQQHQPQRMLSQLQPQQQAQQQQQHAFQQFQQVPQLQHQVPQQVQQMSQYQQPQILVQDPQMQQQQHALAQQPPGLGSSTAEAGSQQLGQQQQIVLDPSQQQQPFHPQQMSPQMMDAMQPMLSSQPQMLQSGAGQLQLQQVQQQQQGYPNPQTQHMSIPFSQPMPNGAPMFQYPVNGLDQQQQQQQQHPNQLLAPPAGMQFSSGGMTAFPGLPPPHQQLVIPQQPSGALVMQSNEQPGSTAVSPPTGNSQTETPKASKGKKRKMRDPKAPKPARYAWNFFFKKEYTRMREKENSDSLDVQQAFTDLTEQVGRKWKSLPPKARAPYVALALEDKRRYEQELAAYNGTPAEELKVPSRTSNFESFASSRAAFGLSIDGIGRRDGGAEGADGEKPKYTWEPQCSADVLVCDDDMAFQLMLKRKLRKAYYKRGKEPTIETATNGEEMLELMLKAGRSYAMVTLDSEMGMANMTGIETIRMLRKANYTGLVVGITAFGDEEHYKAFMDGGVDAVLCKGSKDMFKTLSTLIGDDMTVASSSTDEGSSSTLIAAAAIAREASEVSETDVVKKAEPKAAVTTTPTPTAKETETKAAT